MKNLIIVVLLAIVATIMLAHQYDTFAERRVYIKKQHVKDDLSIKVNIFKSKRELRKAYKEKYPEGDDASEVLGFSTWYSPHDGTCNIYVPEPKDDDDLETWGHELAHCVYGSWHD